MGVGIYYFYHGFGLKAFEGRHIRITIIRILLNLVKFLLYTTKVSFERK